MKKLLTGAIMAIAISQAFAAPDPNFHIMSTAINGTRFEMVPTVQIEGAFVKLTFNRLLFLIPEVDDSPFDANTEVFTISAN